MKTSQSKRQARHLAACLAFISAACFAQAGQQCSAGDLGCTIFSGQRAVKAHLRDDNYSLPSSTTRCINCHSHTDSQGAFAPPLAPAYLLDAKTRRGGPPSRYDLSMFCRAVRDGVDPVNILLRKEMPHFQVSDAECNGLWRFVTNQ